MAEHLFLLSWTFHGGQHLTIVCVLGNRPMAQTKEEQQDTTTTTALRRRMSWPIAVASVAGCEPDGRATAGLSWEGESGCQSWTGSWGQAAHRAGLCLGRMGIA